MKYQYTIENLQDCKNELERGVQWYQQPNRTGVDLSDAYRKERIAELTKHHTEIAHVIKLLTNGRFHAIEEKLIQFNCIEANLNALESMMKRISPKYPKMKIKCLDSIRDILDKFFHANHLQQQSKEKFR